VDLVGEEAATIERWEERDALEYALRRLPARSREIVELRFYEHLSQAEIGRRLGISQMHVSRKLREALGRLRALIGG
jgi:RNA polymerase sigma-B factor